MILIADSGSTKTDWCLAHHGDVVARTATQGINPFYQSDEDIVRVLRDEMVSHWPDGLPFPDRVVFYGAGVRPEMTPRMRKLLKEVFGAEQVDAHGDLLGAARALFGRQAGLACILGTGSNSGLYDGSFIVENTPPLGFILGDEGSGAVIGKHFVADLCKGLLPDELRREFFQATKQDVSDIIRAVYREPLPNRYLAQTTHFIHEHLHLVQYRRPDLPVRAVGSVAFHFCEQLHRAAAEEGFALSMVAQSPMDGLVIYHKDE